MLHAADCCRTSLQWVQKCKIEVFLRSTFLDSFRKCLGNTLETSQLTVGSLENHHPNQPEWAGTIPSSLYQHKAYTLFKQNDRSFRRISHCHLRIVTSPGVFNCLSLKFSSRSKCSTVSTCNECQHGPTAIFRKLVTKRITWKVLMAVLNLNTTGKNWNYEREPRNFFSLEYSKGLSSETFHVFHVTSCSCDTTTSKRERSANAQALPL